MLSILGLEIHFAIVTLETYATQLNTSELVLYVGVFLNKTN